MGSIARKPLLPEFECSVFEGYAVNWLDKNFWRFQYTFGDMEDAVSEAKLCYYVCRRMYGDKVKNLKHFMALYKRMVSTWFCDWSNYDTEQRKLCEIYKQQESVPPEATLTTLLSEASSELKSVVQLIINTPPEIMDVFRADKNRDPEAFFNKAVELSGFNQEKVPILKHELEALLT